MMLLGFDRRDGRMALSLFRMTMRDRFLGSNLGLAWAVATPALMLAIFTFVFGFVFQAKLPGAETSLAFVIWLISGYGPWLAISEGLSASTTSVAANAGIIKNLPFKTELLPIVGALTGLVPLGVAIAFEVVLLAVSGSPPNWTWLALPLVIVLQFVLVAGIGFYLAAVNVFVRDVAVALPNVLLIVLFASPIFYQVSAFPPRLQPVAVLNPFYALTEGYRQPLLYGNLPPLWQLAYVAVLALALFWSGLAFFRRLKSHFDSRL